MTFNKKEYMKEYNKEYRLKNKESINKQVKKYFLKNKFVRRNNQETRKHLYISTT